MTDVRRSNIQEGPFDLTLNGAIANAGVFVVGRALLRRIRAALILAFALQLVGCALFVSKSTPKQEEAQRFESQLQLRVMRFADGYGDAVSRACAQAQSEATDSRLRYRLVDFQIKEATAAVQIAAGSNPSINAVDMVVLASLTRASVAHNLPKEIGGKAQPIIETFARLETGAWSLVDFLTPAQQADLRRRLAAWAPNAASLDSVAFNRLADFAKASGLPAGERDPASSILALIGADPLAGLHPAVREIQRSRILGERAIYYAERTPMLLDLQTRTLTAALADMPESRAVVASVDRVGNSAATLAETAAALPETFSKERDATIQQLVTALEKQQGAMKELLVEFRQSFEAGHEASASIQRMLDTVRSLNEPPPPGTVPGRPFDVTEYTEAAATIGDASKQLQTLITMLKQDTQATTAVGDVLRGQGERLIDHLYKRVLEAFGVLFVGVLLVVTLSRLFVAYLRRQAERANREARLAARALKK
jgi:hypothetical protein